jgi:hypothetical protein
MYNDRLRIARLADEIDLLAEHGIMKPPDQQGLTDEQISELKLKDEYAETCVPSGGTRDKHDDIGRRIGKGMFICPYVASIGCLLHGSPSSYLSIIKRMDEDSVSFGRESHFTVL